MPSQKGRGIKCKRNTRLPRCPTKFVLREIFDCGVKKFLDRKWVSKAYHSVAIRLLYNNEVRNYRSMGKRSQRDVPLDSSRLKYLLSCTRRNIFEHYLHRTPAKTSSRAVGRDIRKQFWE